MDRERLTRLLQEPGRVAREDLGDLRGLVERYPWFAGGHLLLAQGEHAADDVLSEASLLTAAAHLPSRTVLFDAFRASPENPLKRAEQPSDTLPDPVQEEAYEPATLRVVPAETETEAPVEDLAPEVEAEGNTPESAPVHPAATHEAAESEAEIVPPEVAILERQIFEAALASSYELTRELQLERLAEEEKQAPPAPQEPAPTVDEPIDGGTVEQPHEEMEAPVLQPTGRYRFTDWISSANHVEDADDPALSGSRTISDPPKEVAAQPLPAVPPASLIDRFIQSQNPEPQRKAEFFTPQQAGKRSLEEQAGLVTETLARIYAQQGNTAKAREAYRKLALKYPDKSLYFAALEKELED